jgi:alanine-synthesizing transaminase
MKVFEKSRKLDNVCYDVRGPVLEEAERMIEQGISITKLNIGNPAPFGFVAPDDIIAEMTLSLTGSQGYSESKGISSARLAIMDYCKKKDIPNVGLQDIYTGNGVSELITIAMQALLNDGDEILIPAPDYPLWTAAATLAGGKVVHYICDEESEWYPDIEDISRKITEKTKGIVIINPNNPTGALYPVEILEKIAELARRNELIIFADEIYDRLVMDGREHNSMAAVARDLMVVTFNGLSKSHMIAGYRAGWMCLSGDKSHARGYIEGLNMLSSMRLCSNVPAQQIIKTALSRPNSSDALLHPGGRIYEQREYITKRLNSIPGISVVKPKAAFYVFPKIDVKKYNIHDDEKFVLDFLKEQHVLMVHGRGFNWGAPDHFRIVYLPELDDLKLALDKLEDFLRGYKGTC